MALARGGNDLIKTRRKYVHVGSGAASLLRTVLSGRCPLLPTPRNQCTIFQLEPVYAQLFSLNYSWTRERGRGHDYL